MYFLPGFLTHYRALGVERFVFLNDRSDDGSLEYLCQQPDTVVVESNRTYGDAIAVPPALADNFRDLRIMDLWRSLLHDRFAQDRWAVQVDLDEFIHLCDGITFHDVVARLEGQSARAVWGVMLDVYPKDFSALAEQENDTRLDMSATWYFDGEQHLRLRRNRRPQAIHPGARARLYHTYNVDRLYPLLGIGQKRGVKKLLGIFRSRRGPLTYNAVRKPVMVKWGEKNFFRSSHDINLTTSTDYLLPIQHFRFAGALYRKIQIGLRERSYYNDSADHRLLFELLKTMEDRNGTFLYRNSRPIDSFDDFTETGNARGF